MINDIVFTDKFIESKASSVKGKKIIFEKVVHAFYLLEVLAQSDIKFIFKGGTSLMLLLENFDRFSTDIDIIVNKRMFDTFSSKINSLKLKRFIKIEEDIRKPKDIIKKHFKFYYNSIYEDNAYVLLDVVFDNVKYNLITLQNINCNFIDSKTPYNQVFIPNVDEMLGDKLTAFAPNTIGVKYSETNSHYAKNTEIIKQLYDISKLSLEYIDIDVVKQTYNKIYKIQCINRNVNYNDKDCLLDTIKTCFLILTTGKEFSETGKYQDLEKGFSGLKNFIAKDLSYNDLYEMTINVLSISIILYSGQSLDKELEINRNHFLGKYYKNIKYIVSKESYSKLLKSLYLYEMTLCLV